MAWNAANIPAGGDEIEDDEMDELRAAVIERDGVAQLAIFAGGATAAPVDVTDKELAWMSEDYDGQSSAYQPASETLVGNAFWCKDNTDSFKRYVTGAPGATEVNVFNECWGTNDWRVTAADEVEPRHVTDIRDVLDKIVRLRSVQAEFVAVGSDSCPGDDEESWTTARDVAFAFGTYGGSGLLSFTLGLCGIDTTIPPEAYTVEAYAIPTLRKDFDTSGLAGKTVTKAWVIWERCPLLSAGEQKNFYYKLVVEGVTVRTLNSADAADGTYDFPDFGPMDGFVAEITNQIDTTGDTRIDLQIDFDYVSDPDAGDFDQEDATFSKALGPSPNHGNVYPQLFLVVEVGFTYRT